MRGRAWTDIMVTRLRTYNGPSPVVRCYRAWSNHQAIHLEYRTSDGLQAQSPIVAARYVEVEEGQMLLLWVRLVDDHVELELGNDDDSDEDSEDDFDQEQDPGSSLNFYRKLLHLRQNTPALMVGDYQPLDESAGEYLAYLRHSAADRQTCLVLLNFYANTHHPRLSLPLSAVRCLFSTHKRSGQIHLLEEITLAPFEVYIGEKVQ